MALLGGIISVLYGGTLVSFLTVITYPKLKHSIESLMDFPGYFGTIVYGNEYESFMNHLNPKLRKLTETKYMTSGTIANAWRMVGEGTYAFLDSKISAEYIIKTRFTNRYQ